MARRRRNLSRASRIATVNGVSLISRDRRIPTRSVACPTCHAVVGEPCRNYGDTGHSHPIRRRLAVRLLNETPSVPDSDRATQTPGGDQ